MIDLVHTVGTRLPRWASRYFPDVLWRVPTHRRTAYVTFDDGPTTAMTGPLLDVLARFDVPATFFMLGDHARRRPALVRAVADAGHTIGNHTYSHPDAWRSRSSVVLRELEHTTGILEDLVQRPVRWMRPPYGRFTSPMRAWCKVRRQRCTMWDIGPGDFLPGVQKHEIERRVLSSIRPGTIIVLHDNPKASDVTPPALASILRSMKADGWQFRAL